MSTDWITRIGINETRLNTACDATKELEHAMETLESLQPEILALYAYYTSQTWLADHDSMVRNEVPEGLPCGVLTEDAVYDLMTDHMRLAARLRELADVLERTVHDA